MTIDGNRYALVSVKGEKNTREIWPRGIYLIPRDVIYFSEKNKRTDDCRA